MSENEEATPIKKEGKYKVTIRGPLFYQLAEKDGVVNRFKIVLPGFTEDNQCADGELYFTPQIIQTGTRKGQTIAEVSAAKCVELGMEAPFHPSKLIDLDGVECEFDIQNEVYEDVERLKVKWINAHAREPLGVDKAAEMWDALSGKASGGGTIEPGEDLPI